MGIALWLSPSYAEQTLYDPQSFIAEAYDDAPPKAKILWLDDTQVEDTETILERPAPNHMRYWLKDGRSVWILEQIGKYQPITTGFVVDNGKIAQLKVLIYRESHGWEVKYPFFTDQFIGVTLQDMQSHKLNKDIDGIAGATLSVRALIQLATLALTLDNSLTHE
ncbi:MAG: FMN-binding protein [Alphaproteobacteria bacterium]|nr:FMN-binding protein [Alphaproteobacteria bacterium]